MSELLVDQKAKRLVSLDAFRGITIAGMILVNNPGNWGAIYKPLGHAKWNGWTPTDLIFPFFLFIVGVAIVYAFGRRMESGASKRDLYSKIFKRTIYLFGIGLYMAAFRKIPSWSLYSFGVPFLVVVLIYWILQLTGKNKVSQTPLLKWLKWIMLFLAWALAISGLQGLNLATLRIPGVLQRIAVTYCVASLIFLHSDIKWQAYIASGLLVAYWLVMKLIPVPGYGAGLLEPTGNLAWYIDSHLLSGHTWSGAPAPGFDPEGILSTIPAIVTVLFGILTGHWLKTQKNDYEKTSGLFVSGLSALVLGIILNIWFPINKNLWSPSYTIFTTGMALLFLGVCYYLIDIKGYQKWSKPFVIFGSNAIAVYTLSSLTAKALVFWFKVSYHSEQLALKTCLYKALWVSWLQPVNASLMYALSYVAVWFIFVWILYQRKIFIKI
jgi:predicted acyltransferase